MTYDPNQYCGVNAWRDVDAVRAQFPPRVQPEISQQADDALAARQGVVA